MPNALARFVGPDPPISRATGSISARPRSVIGNALNRFAPALYDKAQELRRRYRVPEAQANPINFIRQLAGLDAESLRESGGMSIVEGPARAVAPIGRAVAREVAEQGPRIVAGAADEAAQVARKVYPTFRAAVGETVEEIRAWKDEAYNSLRDTWNERLSDTFRYSDERMRAAAHTRNLSELREAQNRIEALATEARSAARLRSRDPISPRLVTEQEAPERITNAAVRFRGQVHEGLTHALAREAGEGAGVQGLMDQVDDVEDLFRTSTGRLVNREEAAAIARAQAQLRAAPKEGIGLAAEDLRRSAPEQQALAEGRARATVRHAESQLETARSKHTELYNQIRRDYGGFARAPEELRNAFRSASDDLHDAEQLHKGAVQAAPRAAVVPEEFPRASRSIDGLEVGENISNMESIGSSLVEYETLPGVREMDLSMFDDVDYASASDNAKVKSLARQIEESGRIDPLIIVVGHDGPYVLEGGHRLGALHLLGKKKFPAKVVFDRS